MDQNGRYQYHKSYICVELGEVQITYPEDIQSWWAMVVYKTTNG